MPSSPPPQLTCFLAGILTDGLGLEVVVVSQAATVDEVVASVVFLTVPPTGKVSHAGARVLW